ncbi:MAG TPA: hypothetical protein VFG76_01225 [Candidatus Polarisedimenticolia bacterium]|nr:hypothetical protein [Candidatus Polarisedimenticolia bacterium]
MTNRRLATGALAIVMAVAMSQDARAALRTVRVPFTKQSRAALSLEAEQIKVVGYQLSRNVRGSENPFSWRDGPSLRIEVRNDGAEPRDFSLAAALFDNEGNLVGVATGAHTGKLDPGEIQEIKVEFKDVNQNVPRATVLYMSLETHS